MRGLFVNQRENHVVLEIQAVVAVASVALVSLSLRSIRKSSSMTFSTTQYLTYSLVLVPCYWFVFQMTHVMSQVSIIEDASIQLFNLLDSV